MTQETLARRSGLARSYVASLEKGHRNVGLVNLSRLAAALEVPMADLFPVELFPPRPDSAAAQGGLTDPS